MFWLSPNHSCLTPAQGNGVVLAGVYAAALLHGEEIGTQKFSSSYAEMAGVSNTLIYIVPLRDRCVFEEQGTWGNVSTHYLGLSFQIDGETHYGWARLNVTVTRDSIKGTVTGYAYETVPGMPISTGQTTGDSSAMSPAQ
jgi:hypothetical protein